MDTSTRTARGMLAMLAVPSLGNAGATKLAERFGTIEEAATASDAEIKIAVNKTVRDNLRRPDIIAEALNAADRELERAERFGCRVLTIHDGEYPLRLRGIPEAPLVLYVKGNLCSLDRSVASVGTRFPSAYGAKVTDRLSSVLCEAGWSIVSGMAIGVDSISHEASLRAGVPTVAILGCGMDSIGRGERGALADRILDGGGALMTEQFFGQRDDAGTLIRRNRLQSGSSAATFVMQCGIESGTMHTVRYAIYQGRKLFVPLPPDDYAEEEENAGVMLIATANGINLGETIRVKESLQKVLESKFQDRPVAEVVRGRMDYPRMLEMLEEQLNMVPEPTQPEEPALF